MTTSSVQFILRFVTSHPFRVQPFACRAKVPAAHSPLTAIACGTPEAGICMGIIDKIRGEFIDIIEWTDDSRDTIVWRFPRHENEIKMNAKLTVRESQAAVFVNEGQVADAFKPGMYTL